MVRENKMWVKLLSFKYLTGKVDSTTLGALGENLSGTFFLYLNIGEGENPR